MDEDNIGEMEMEMCSRFVVLEPVLNPSHDKWKSEFVESCFLPIRCKFVATR